MHQSEWQKGPRGGPFCRSRSSLTGFGGLILGRDATGTTLALLEAIAVAVHLEDVDVVGQAVEQSVEGQIAGDDGGAALVA